jgi:hypothetical protein
MRTSGKEGREREEDGVSYPEMRLRKLPGFKGTARHSGESLGL